MTCKKDSCGLIRSEVLRWAQNIAQTREAFRRNQKADGRSGPQVQSTLASPAKGGYGLSSMEQASCVPHPAVGTGGTADFTMLRPKIQIEADCSATPEKAACAARTRPNAPYEVDVYHWVNPLAKMQ